jgi:hypothetical protein
MGCPRCSVGSSSQRRACGCVSPKRWSQSVEEPSRIIDSAEAARIAGTTPRWLLHRTRGLGFPARLQPEATRFDERALRRWIDERRRR